MDKTMIAVTPLISRLLCDELDALFPMKLGMESDSKLMRKGGKEI